MKIYYDSNGDGVPDTQVTGIVEYPDVTINMNMPSTCVIVIRDFEVGLFATWEPRDFIKMSIKDDSENQIFIGYLIRKSFTYNSLKLTIMGFGIKLTWTPFNNNYTLEQGQLRNIVDGETITCYLDADGDRDYDVGEEYNWTPDQWIEDDQDKGIIVETPAGLNSELWKCSALDDAGDWDGGEAGDHTHTQVYLDGNHYYAYDLDGSNGNITEFTIDSTWDGGEDVIPDTKFLKRIHINYRYQLNAKEGVFGGVKLRLEIYNYNDTTWEPINSIWHDTLGDSKKTMDSVGGLGYISTPLRSHILEQSSSVTLSDYLDDDGGGNWDTIKLRLRLTGDNNANVYIWCDYLAVKIEYHSDDVGAIMRSITNNAASTLTSTGADWDNLGVDEDDGFKIGENTRQILEDIISTAELGLKLINPIAGSETEDTGIDPNADGNPTSWNTTGGNHFGELIDSNDATEVHTAIINTEEVVVVPYILHNGNIITQIDLHTRVKKAAGTITEFAVYLSFDKGITYGDAIPISLTNNWVNEVDIVNLIGTARVSGITDDVIWVKFRTPGAMTGSTIYISEFYLDVHWYNTKFSKYDARDFKGSFCIGALEKIRKLEGAHWCEDHEDETIVIVKPADFEDNGVDLDSTDYEDDWEFDDKCNTVKSVTVYGNAALRVKAVSTAGDQDSPIHRQIIDEGIASYDNALKVAESEVGLFSSKTPSFQITVDGTQTTLKVCTDVHITFEKPDGTVVIAQTLYPISKINRRKKGITGIETTIWCGLGKTTETEKIAKELIKAAFMAQDAHQARLTATPAGQGAALTWGDIGGAQGAVESIITAELVDGQSIDNAIDALVTFGNVDSGTDFNSHSEQVKAGFHIIGGGTITVDGSYRVGWTQRMLVMNAGRGTHFSTTGFFQIDQPTSGVITAVGGGTANTWNASGIIISGWNSLYYILPIGSNHTSIAANFRMVGYTSDLEIPDDWILIAKKHHEGGAEHIKFGVGIQLNASETWVQGTASMIKYTNAQAVAAVNAAGLALANTKVITSQDADLTFIFGRAQIDSRFADMMIISHRDMSGQDQYAFGQLNDGKTYINAPTGKLIYFQINDVTKMSMSVNSLAMGIPIAMGAHNITLGVGQLVDGVDISDHAANNDANIKHLTDAQLGALHADTVTTALAVENIINAEIAEGQSINSAIDALILAHHDAASGDHDDRYYTESEVDAFHAIGVGNKRWIALLLEGSRYEESIETSIYYQNRDGVNNQIWFGVPLPYIIGGKNLVITGVKIGIEAGDANDYISDTRWYGWSDHTTWNNFLSNADDIGEGGTEEDVWNHVDTTIGGVYERIVLLLQIVATGALDLKISYVLLEYYYA